MARRVALARAFAVRPTLLLMDEPSLGLAPKVVDEVFQVIETVRAGGVSVLLVEQNVQRALDVSSRAYLLSEGRMVMEGTTEELANSPEIRRSVLGL